MTVAGDPAPGAGVPADPPGEALLEETPCLLCGSEEGEVRLTSRVQLAPNTGERFHLRDCRRCGLTYLSPRPTPERMGRYYPPDYLSHRGPEAWGRWSPLVRASLRRMDGARVRRVRRAVSLAPGDPVLDVGCGRPSFLCRLQDRTGIFPVGVDSSDGGWRDDPQKWNGLTLLRGTPSSLEARLRTLGRSGPGPGSSASGFRVITLWHALEHDHDPLSTLRALARLAAPDGRLVVEVPDLGSWTAWWFGPHWAGLHTPRHTALHTRETLIRTVEAGGWVVEDHLPYGTLDPYLLVWMSRAVRRGDDLSGPLAPAFPRFLLGRIVWLPLSVLGRRLPLGVQTVVARPPT